MKVVPEENEMNSTDGGWQIRGTVVIGSGVAL
jgi:hypothetical protein